MNPYAAPETECPAPPAAEQRFRIYWTAGSIPELDDLSEEERGRLWRRHWLKAFRHWQTWLAALSAAGCSSLPFIFIFLSMNGWITPRLSRIPIWFIPVSGCIGAIASLPFAQVWIAITRPYLREARAELERSASAAGDPHTPQNR